MEEGKISYESESPDNPEFMRNKAYLKYLGDFPNLEEMDGVFIAYQNQKIVYVGSPKIKNGLDLAIEKISNLLCNDHVFIFKVGE